MASKEPEPRRESGARPPLDEEPEGRSVDTAEAEHEAEYADEAGQSADPRAANGETAADAGEEAAAPAAAELEAMRDRYLRLAAEYDNYRKRTERERLESWTRAQAQLVEHLLEPLDDLQRVADAEPQGRADSLLEGVRLVERKLRRVLESAGVEILDAEGQAFDPAVHEALMTSPTEERDQDDTVAEVFQNGYLFKGHLLRPARVRVHKYTG